MPSTSPVSSHIEARKPSVMLASLSALIVASFNPKWLAAPVAHLVGPEEVSPERLSRLKARLLDPIEALVTRATRRGRPPTPPQPADESNVLKALLAVVPPEAWTYLRKDRRDTLVQAQARLGVEHGLSAERFCELLGICPRTFRNWKATAAAPVPLAVVPEEPAPKQQGSKNAGRFDLEVTAPGLQTMADTTKWELFGVPLSVVAAQDPGDRKRKLWESFAVDTEENAGVVIDVLTEALGEKAGGQCVIDQGAPYMAELTKEALEKLDVEHAPQKEGTPTDKATKERAFGIVKSALKPLADLTGRLAEKLPQLRRPELAKALGKLLLATFLRVYEAAPRIGGHPLDGEQPDILRVIVEEQRENARAEYRSTRLTLTAIHQAYDFSGGVAKFIRTHRNHALEDIQEAERRFRARLQKIEGLVPIKNRRSYFAAVLRGVAEQGRTRRARIRNEKLAYARQEKQMAEGRRIAHDRVRRRRDHPEEHLEEGLEFVVRHWSPKTQTLLFAGKGFGRRFIREALESMQQQNPHNVRDRAEARWHVWAAKHTADILKVNAVRHVFESLCVPFDVNPPFPKEIISDRMAIPSRNRSPCPLSRLRNYPARTRGT
jgi:hypothetical protein